MSKKPHQPISKDRFRVLRVSETQPTIVCQLIDHSIHQPPEYYAISYAWGTEPASQTLLCNGEEFAVTPHLYECITSISHLYGFQDIWIDAICIDQQNDAEKAEQVSMMGQIYKQAQKVYIWLGAAENGSVAAFDFIQSHAETLLAQGLPENLDPRRYNPEAHFFNNLTMPLAESIWAMCMRSWFHRLWTVQEITLARRTEFVCGLKSLNGDILSLFAVSMIRGAFMQRVLESFYINLEGDLEGFASLGLILNWKQLSSSPGRFSMFATFVQWCRTKEVKHPVDRIYGLLGLCGKDDAYFQGITADYSESNTTQYWQVYSNFGKLCLLHEPDLYLLSLTGSKVRPPGLPSWCPNFDSRPQQPSGLPTYSAGWPAKNHCQGQSKTAHCLSRHPSFKQREDCYVRTSSTTQEIETQGCVVDRVAQVSDKYVFSNLRPSRDNPARLLCSNRISWFFGMKDMARSACRTSDDIPDALWRTVVGDVDRTPQGIRWPCRRERRDQFSLYEQCLQYLLDDFSTDAQGGDRDVSTVEFQNFLNQNRDAIEESASDLSPIWEGRSFFTTTKGRIGFASESVKAGDLICMFYSGPSVYILREVSGAESPIFNFVSDGYTHGLMGGEAFDLLDRGEAEEQKFTII